MHRRYVHSKPKGNHSGRPVAQSPSRPLSRSDGSILCRWRWIKRQSGRAASISCYLASTGGNAAQCIAEHGQGRHATMNLHKHQTKQDMSQKCTTDVSVSVEETFASTRATQAGDPIVGTPFALELVIVRQLLVCHGKVSTPGRAARRTRKH